VNSSSPTPLGGISRPAQPWDSAVRKRGIIPDQAILYPRPVILMCGECGTRAYWYPKENTIELYSNRCHPFVEGGHNWAVLDWNRNAVVSADTADIAGNGGTGEQP
jgi:hypothetical protein